MNYTGIQVAHIRLMRVGTYLTGSSGDTATRALAPDLEPPHTDSQNWTDVGDVSVSSDQPNLGNAIEIVRKKPHSTQMQRVKEIRTGPISRTITFTALNRTKILGELHLMSGPINDASTTVGNTTAVVPFAGGAAAVEGWFGIAYYDESSNLLTNELHWGELRLGQPLAGGPTAQVTPQYVLTVFPDDNAAAEVLKKTT